MYRFECHQCAGECELIIHVNILEENVPIPELCIAKKDFKAKWKKVNNSKSEINTEL